jgi:hypothetical protein
MFLVRDTGIELAPPFAAELHKRWSNSLTWVSYAEPS